VRLRTPTGTGGPTSGLDCSRHHRGAHRPLRGVGEVVMFNLPDFSKDIESFRRELVAIRQLLEKLLEVEEAKK
jgi:hypothetical protein